MDIDLTRLEIAANKDVLRMPGYDMYGDGIDVKLFRSLNEFAYRNMLRIKGNGYRFDQT
mgnify:CR=1 FL=1